MISATRDATASPHDELTERLLDSAAEVFVECGIDRAGVAAVARRAGVTTGAIYSRWSCKHEMMIATLDRVMSRELTDALLARSEPSATDVLQDLGHELVASRDRSADCLMMEALALARRDVEFGGMLARMFADQESLLASVIDEGKAAGTIDQDLDTDAIVALCHAISLGFVMFGAIDRPMPSAQGWDQVIRRMVSAVIPIQPATSQPGNTGDI